MGSTGSRTPARNRSKVWLDPGLPAQQKRGWTGLPWLCCPPAFASSEPGQPLPLVPKELPLNLSHCSPAAAEPWHSPAPAVLLQRCCLCPGLSQRSGRSPCPTVTPQQRSCAQAGRGCLAWALCLCSPPCSFPALQQLEFQPAPSQPEQTLRLI